MSADIRTLAYSEAPTLGVAIALMAKRRNDLDAAMRQAAATQQMPVASEGAAEVRAIAQITPPAATQQLLDVKV
jgi:hypothetical protein